MYIHMYVSLHLSGSAPKPPRPSPEPFPELLNLTWLCTKASQTFAGTFSGTFSRTFSGTLLNLTWLCTKASQTFSGTFGTFSGTLLNLTRRLHQCTPELFWAQDPISLRCWGISFGGIPQQPQRFIFTSLSEARCEAKRWKNLSWVSVI